MSPAYLRVRSWWQQLAAIMIKEAKQVTRDPSSWIIAVVQLGRAIGRKE